jgi:hypothetical protein
MRLKVLMALAALFLAPMAFAGTYSLNDWCFYVNSLDINQSCNSGSGLANVPLADPGVTDLLHLQADNTGTLTVHLNPGNYNVFVIFNYDIDGNGNNEYAQTFGSLAVGQVYSVNNESGTGGLYSQGEGGTLDGTNSCALGCSDTAVAFGYTNINVPSGSTGTLIFTAGAPPSNPNAFVVHQSDPSSGNAINFSSSIQIDGGLNAQIQPVPEPVSMALVGTGLYGLAWLSRRRRKS